MESKTEFSKNMSMWGQRRAMAIMMSIGSLFVLIFFLRFSSFGEKIFKYIQSEDPVITHNRHMMNRLAKIKASRPGDLYIHTNGSVWIVLGVSVTAGTIDLQSTTNIQTVGIEDATHRLGRLVDDGHVGLTYGALSSKFVQQFVQQAPKMAHKK